MWPVLRQPTRRCSARDIVRTLREEKFMLILWIFHHHERRLKLPPNIQYFELDYTFIDVRTLLLQSLNDDSFIIDLTMLPRASDELILFHQSILNKVDKMVEFEHTALHQELKSYYDGRSPSIITNNQINLTSQTHTKTLEKKSAQRQVRSEMIKNIKRVSNIDPNQPRLLNESQKGKAENNSVTNNIPVTLPSKKYRISEELSSKDLKHLSYSFLLELIEFYSESVEESDNFISRLQACLSSNLHVSPSRHVIVHDALLKYRSIGSHDFSQGKKKIPLLTLNFEIDFLLFLFEECGDISLAPFTKSEDSRLKAMKIELLQQRLLFVQMIIYLIIDSRPKNILWSVGTRVFESSEKLKGFLTEIFANIKQCTEIQGIRPPKYFGQFLGQLLYSFKTPTIIPEENFEIPIIQLPDSITLQLYSLAMELQYSERGNPPIIQHVSSFFDDLSVFIYHGYQRLHTSVKSLEISKKDVYNNSWAIISPLKHLLIQLFCGLDILQNNTSISSHVFKFFMDLKNLINQPEISNELKSELLNTWVTDSLKKQLQNFQDILSNYHFSVLVEKPSLIKFYFPILFQLRNILIDLYKATGIEKLQKYYEDQTQEIIVFKCLTCSVNNLLDKYYPKEMTTKEVIIYFENMIKTITYDLINVAKVFESLQKGSLKFLCDKYFNAMNDVLHCLVMSFNKVQFQANEISIILEEIYVLGLRAEAMGELISNHLIRVEETEENVENERIDSVSTNKKEELVKENLLSSSSFNNFALNALLKQLRTIIEITSKNVFLTDVFEPEIKSKYSSSPADLGRFLIDIIAPLEKFERLSDQIKYVFCTSAMFGIFELAKHYTDIGTFMYNEMITEIFNVDIEQACDISMFGMHSDDINIKCDKIVSSKELAVRLNNLSQLADLVEMIRNKFQEITNAMTNSQFEKYSIQCDQMQSILQQNRDKLLDCLAVTCIMLSNSTKQLRNCWICSYLPTFRNSMKDCNIQEIISDVKQISDLLIGIYRGRFATKFSEFLGKFLYHFIMGPIIPLRHHDDLLVNQGIIVADVQILIDGLEAVSGFNTNIIESKIQGKLREIQRIFNLNTITLQSTYMKTNKPSWLKKKLVVDVLVHRQETKTQFYRDLTSAST
eukprot:TRINITY_DN7522_c0_g1_i1.p1 TRINITY_DN7522_c0_g1~~TRINITY_DN7522_c0_g1_i1.p1  ORF type:complete len:1124 (+),score=293.80 TRINITY_DN7522_c0_g1_i1:35-3406(+)